MVVFQFHLNLPYLVSMGTKLNNSQNYPYPYPYAKAFSGRQKLLEKEGKTTNISQLGAVDYNDDL